MKINSVVFLTIRVAFYMMVMFGVAQIIYFDVAHPAGNSFVTENSFTEIGQEAILFLVFAIYLFLGFKWKAIQPVSNIISLFFLISFIREFNNYFEHWIYPVAVIMIITVLLIIRDWKKIWKGVPEFFSLPVSNWLISGFLITYVFSRLFGRGKLWRILYNDETYRYAKNVAEEGIELLGYSLILISAVELLIYYYFEARKNSGIQDSESTTEKT